MNYNAFNILSNYSSGFYGFLDLINETVALLHIYSTNVMRSEQHDASYWIRFLEYLQDEYSIMLIADVITLDYSDFMLGFDGDTYFYGLTEEIGSFHLGITHEQRAERYRCMAHPTVWERVFDRWNNNQTKLYIVGVSMALPGDDEFEFDDVEEFLPGVNEPNNDNIADVFDVFSTFAEKPHFAQVNKILINEAVGKRTHKRIFQYQINEELIAEAMQPCCMMAHMQICADIKQFFECC